jgi:hypothetical protein
LSEVCSKEVQHQSQCTQAQAGGKMRTRQALRSR